MKKFLFTMSLVCLSVFTFAQSMEISGKVTSADDGIGLPGVSVSVQGTTKGTTTDVDGNYSIEATKGATLVYSFVGMVSQSITVGNQSVINVSLQSDANQLSEIVVTSTGLNRNAKNVVYANQTVKSEALLSTPGKNALESLRGKAAGVRINTSSGSVGASTRIVLRGEGSLTGDNNALIVVDGIPIDNTANSGGAGTASSGYADYGNRFNDLNPEDIESITILKGPSATSLYGSRGASGVLLVTTKKGKDGTVKVGVNSSYSTERAYILTQRQDGYGQGYDNAHFDSGENWSWGPAFDGVVRPWTSAIDSDGDGSLEALTRPYENVPNQLQSFFNLGNTLNNNFNVSAGKGGFNYYLSYGNTLQNGILDNTKYNRHSINLTASAQLTPKLKSDFNVSYSLTNQTTATEGARAFEGANAWAMVLQSPVNIPFNEVRDYTSPFHDLEGYWGSYSSVNPYYILNEYNSQANIGNLFTKVSLTYTPIKNLDLIARVGNNSINMAVTEAVPSFTRGTQLIWGDDLALGTRNGRHNSLGSYLYQDRNRSNWDVSTLANYSTDIPGVDGLKLNAVAGWNMFDKRYKRIGGNTVGGLVVPGWYNLSNSTENPQSFQNSTAYRIMGALGNASLSYKDTYFLEYSARNDWSSTLPVANNSFFYQAVGASVILSDALNIDSKFLDFAKLRGSYGTTGKDAGLYLLNSTFSGNPTIASLGDYSIFFPLNGQPGFTTGNAIGNPNLKPELTTTFEIGADISLLNNRVNLDYTYYSSNHTNQIVTINLPASTGFSTTTANIGQMTNKGHEVSLILKPIKGLVNGLNWDINLLYAKNKNNVVKITDDITELTVGGSNRGITTVAKEGYPFGTFKGLTEVVNSSGQTVVGATGFPVLTDSDQYLGSYQPDYTASVGTTIGYKGLSLNALLDIRQGGTFFSWTKFYTGFNGTGMHTVEYGREPFVYPNSVTESGEANTTEITAQDFYTNYDPAPAHYLVDASFIKLREIGLNYAIPAKILSKAKIKTATLGVYANNVKFWLPADNTYADPEVNGPSLTGNAVGIETTQIPPAQSLGFKLGLTF